MSENSCCPNHVRLYHARDQRSPAEITLATIRSILARVGWLEGPPPFVKSETLGIDRAIARRLRCDGCRARGSMKMHTFYRRLPQSFRHVVVCEACGQAGEM